MRIINIPEIGEVHLTKAGRSRKNFNIYVLPDGIVKVSMPQGSTYKDARKAVINLKGRIIQKKEKQKNLKSAFTVFDRDSKFNTRFHSLNIIAEEGNSRYFYWAKEKLIVNIPFNEDIKTEYNQNFIRHAIETTWRREALTIIPEKTKNIALQYDFKISGISITKAKQRWGSCSSKNKLNFSLYLMRLPDELIDYIIMHELCHTVHRNHGEGFYKLLDELTEGNHKKLDKKLQEISPAIY